MSSVPPDGVSPEVWIEWKNRINQYFKEFGRTAYEFDFAYSTPQETLTPTFESIKTFVEGKVESPFYVNPNLKSIGNRQKKKFYNI